MKKLFLSLIILAMSTICLSQTTKSIYDFKLKTLEGKEFDFSQLKGKRVLIVNTASQCGFTHQYKDLEALYEKYSKDNFIILGFPANNFGAQEPGSNTEIKEFCTKNFGVTFPMFEKISVKGDDMAPLYHWLTEKSENGVLDSSVKWNFQKYLIDENGKLVDTVGSMKSPDTNQIIDFITKK